MSHRLPGQDSVRPPPDSSEDGGGPSRGAGSCEEKNRHHWQRKEEGTVVRAMFPVGEADSVGVSGSDDVLCSRCGGEEEDAVVPTYSPATYQPTRSEYLGHCVTHYPFRV